MVELIDLDCGDSLKKIMYICNMRYLQYLMLRHGTQFCIFSICFLVVFCFLKEMMDKSVKCIQKNCGPCHLPIDDSIHLELAIILNGLFCFIYNKKKWIDTILLFD